MTAWNYNLMFMNRRHETQDADGTRRMAAAPKVTIVAAAHDDPKVPDGELGDVTIVNAGAGYTNG